MNASEYKSLKQQGNVLDFPTLDATHKFLEKAENLKLAQRIIETLGTGEIDKPSQHNNPTEHTSFYHVSLSHEDIEVIILMLGDLEVSALDENYHTTASASFFASLLDKWNDLLLQRSGRDASASSA